MLLTQQAKIIGNITFVKKKYQTTTKITGYMETKITNKYSSFKLKE